MNVDIIKRIGVGYSGRANHLIKIKDATAAPLYLQVHWPQEFNYQEQGLRGGGPNWERKGASARKLDLFDSELRFAVDIGEGK